MEGTPAYDNHAACLLEELLVVHKQLGEAVLGG